VINTAARPFLIIKNLVTDSDISVTDNSKMTNYGYQGHSHGTLWFSTVALSLIKLL